jgi:hypothetical protein
VDRWHINNDCIELRERCAVDSSALIVVARMA